jgi:hypothetical protein
MIPRGHNQTADALATLASVFKIPIFPNKRYEIEVKHRPTIPDNIKYWQVFEDAKQIESFLNMDGEFANLNIDEEYCGEKKMHLCSKMMSISRIILLVRI